jgi:hypothetical protein
MSEKLKMLHAITVGSIWGTGVFNANRFSSPYAPPCTMRSANSGENPMMSATRDAKTEMGETAAKEATTATGEIHLMAVSDSGDGTRSATAVTTQSAQPHDKNAIDVAVGASSASTCQGDATASTIHAANTTPNMMRDGVI